MCDFQTLYHHNDHGYVVRCAHCNNIQIGFGNMMLTFPRDEFDAFRFWLKQMQEMYADTEMPEYKKGIVIPTPCDGIKLLFSKTELASFNSMLENADTEMQSLELISLFEI
ncbi:MAG: hypothetical protein J0I41_07700 [Filimonas sp.]|nr:hypothetical protein [Filimonas sp.]